MGYCTHYSLTMDGPDDEVTTAVVHLEDADGGEDDVLQTIYDVYRDAADSMKWYDHEDDVRRFSAQHPSVRITLKGEGEINDDMWVKYFKAGKMQKCPARIEFDEYDERKLK